ncbi:NACHT domain-containing protein [Chryseosolibacter indicus]|uniref:NACHT domain-containing protein n=1 Tax=Chryseosolibacter indicus TaxID=2782351 RepID=A0ABS5VSN5_9BACT|nr:NACHT domain-containing protein [Chryseosolibacter indicus]MBT1704442.1 NACHT domain-containing protein [Chryseosolibacter indicus]
MDNSKIEKIESLPLDQLVEIVKSILPNIGYSSIEDFTTDTIRGAFKTALSTDIHYFFISQIKPTGAEVDLSLIQPHISAIEKQRASLLYFVSPFYISEGFKSKVSNLSRALKVNFIGRDEVIQLIDHHNPGYWRHSDTVLLDYEKSYCAEIVKDSQLKKLPIFNDKYEKVLNIFIEPRIYHLSQELETNTPTRKRVSLEQIIEGAKPALITGDPGTGKSTSLKKIGEQIVHSNRDSKIKGLPLYFSVVEVFEADYDVSRLINNKLTPYFGAINDDFFEQYKLTLLVDSLDELEEQNQRRVVEQLKQLFADKGVKFIIGTRNDDKLQINTGLAEYNSYKIERFNQDQIKRFITSFFPSHETKAEKLIEALKDNRIIEKLPLTPLTLSLISILFEENDLEIPATITDIFDNFNSLLIGKATVSSRIEFVDVSFKERILSLYAYQLLKTHQHSPYTREEFYNFFKEYFFEKTIPLGKGSLEEALDYLINNTGILTLKNNKYVKFSHDSFLEYYAALEIFKHRREDQLLLVDNFFENNWQNAAIFYAGKSKDMPKFLEEVLLKLDSANRLNDLLSAVMGAGFLLQALYQTDNKLRRDTILKSIDLNLKIHEIYSKLFSDETLKLKNYKMPILWLMNVIYFHESFNSVTLKEPLKLAFWSLSKEYMENKKTLSGYKALQVALTLDSRRINEGNELQTLIFDSNLTNDAILCMLADFSVEIIKGANYELLKKELKKEIKRLREPLKTLTSQSISRLRFSALDLIRLDRKIKLITEGKTDAELLEHAFMVLMDGNLPYWEVFPVGKEEGGGASKLRDALRHAISFNNDEEVIIGIFDHDSAGLQHFNGLQFPEVRPKMVKKLNELNIFAISLPVPGHLSHYIEKDQNLNFFEIEHYFDIEFLRAHDMLETTSIPNVYKISEKKKSAFVKAVKKNNDPATFKNFKLLFECIDNINEIDLNYNA